MRKFNCAVVNAKEPSWLDALRRINHDVYHLPEYASVSAIADGGSAMAIVASDGDSHFLLPLVRRDLDSEFWDAASPYGFAGPIWSDNLSEAEREGALEAALLRLQNEGCVSLFIRGHPVLGQPWPEQLLSADSRARSTTTVLMDLSRFDLLWQETSSSHRNKINRAVREGYLHSWDESLSWYSHFIESYRSDMIRLGSSSYYFFDDAYFEALQDRLRDNLRLAVSLKNGEFAAGILFLTKKPWAHYHLPTTHSRHRNSTSPGKALLHFARMDLASEGFKSLNLGGGLGGHRDDLFRFKAGFSSGKASFPTAGVVLNPDEYVRRSQSSLGEDGFFPAYRAARLLGP